MKTLINRTLSALLCVAMIFMLLPLSATAGDDEPYIEINPVAMYGAAQGNSMVFGGLIHYPPSGLNSWNYITVEGDIWDGYLLADCNPGSGSGDTNYATFKITVPETTPAGVYNIRLKIEQQLDIGIWRHITSNGFTFQVFEKDSEVFVITPNQEAVTKGNVFYGNITTENHAWGLDWSARPGDVIHWMNNEYGSFSLEDVTVNNLPDDITANAWIPITGPNVAFICIETDNLPVGRHTVTVTCAGVTSEEFDIVVTEPDEPEIVGIEVFSDPENISYWDMGVVGINETILGTPIQIVVRANYSDGSDEFLHAGALDFYIEEGNIPLLATEIDNDPQKPYIQIQTDSLLSGVLSIGASLKSNPVITGSVTVNLLDYVIVTYVEGQEEPPFMATVHTGQTVQLFYRVFPENYDESSLVMSDWQREYPDGSIGTDSFISQDGELSIGSNETAESFFITPPFHWEDHSGRFLLIAPEIRIAKNPLSDDATLTSLTVTAGELSPAFSPDTTDYTVTVPYSADSIHITAIVNDINAAVSGTGTKALVVGENTLRVVVFAEDGSDKTYTITVTREAPPASGDFIINVASLTGDISNENWSYNHANGIITLSKDVFIIGEKNDADKTLVFNIPTLLTAIWKAEYSGSTAASNALVELRGAGTFEVADGNITQTGGGNAVYIPYNNTEAEFRGKLNINGGEISVTNGHAIYREGPNTGNVYYCNININGGTIRRTGGNADGSAIHYGLAYLTMTGGEIISSGWCIDAYYSRSLLIEGGTIKSTASAIRGNMIFDTLKMTGGAVEASNDAIYTLAGAIIEGGTVSAGDFAVFVDESLTRYDVYVAYLAGTIASGNVVRPEMAYATVVEVDTLAIPLSRHDTSTGITELSIPTGVTWKAVTWDMLHWDNLPSLHFQPTIYTHGYYGWGYTVNNESDGISLDKTGMQTFPDATYGYSAAPNAMTVTVSNTGNQATGALSVSLSGANSGSFTLSKASIGSIAVSGSDTFTIKPDTGLSAGYYTATVTVSGGNIAAQSFTVSFTVDKKPLENVMIAPITAQTYCGSQLTPPITVKDGGTALTLNTDYENMSYGANVNAGTNTGSVTITGKGNYSGAATANFTIDPAPLTLTADNKTIIAGAAEPVYTYSISGLQGSDTAAAVIITAPALNVADFNSTTAGSFTINISGGAVNSNYTITNRVNGTLTVSALPSEATPDAAINYTAEKLTGLVAGAAYSINGGASISADSSGIIAINSSWFGTDISIVKKGDGMTKTDSGAQVLTIPARPSAPVTLVGEAGKIAGVDSTMEYKLRTASAWTPINGTTVSGLEAGNYEVRVKAAANAFAGVAANVTVTAVTSYTITFDANGGSVSPTSAQTGADGKLASLPAPMRSGSYSFNGWYTAAGGSTEVTANTVFSADTTIYAGWTYTGNSGGGSSGAGTSPQPTEEPVDADISSDYITVTQNAETGEVSANLSKEEADKALEKVAETGKLTIIIPKTDTINEETPVSATIAGEAMNAIAESGAALTIDAPSVSMTFDADAVSAISGAGEVKITAGIADTDDLNTRQKEAVGDRPVYDFVVTVGGTAMRDLGGNVTVSLPYTPSQGEDPNAIIISYIDADGNVQTVKNCVYDIATGSVTFTTDHFSLYMIAYNAKIFSDVKKTHWAANSVTFVTARELFNGTAATTFEPESSMTRAMFVMILANLEDADLSAYTTSRFGDVTAGKWYTAAVEWAADMGIVSGTGGGRFDPNAEITREQMAVMLYNYMMYKGIAIPSGTAGVFTDESGIGSWALEAVKAIQKTGIISGKPGNLFDPKGIATRAEAATIFTRFLESTAGGALTRSEKTANTNNTGSMADTSSVLAMLPEKENYIVFPENDEPDTV